MRDVEAPGQRQPAQRHRQRVADAASRSRNSARSSTTSHDARYPIMGAHAAAPRRHRPPRRGRLGLCPRRRRARRRHHPELRSHRHPPRRRPGRRRRDQPRASSAPRRSASSPPAIPACWRRWPASACRSRAIRCRRWCRSRSSRCSHCVVMSNAVHVYVSQSDKGELVIGAGIDAYNSLRPARQLPRHRAHSWRDAARCSRSSAGCACCASGAASSTSARTLARSSGKTPVDGPVLQLRLGHRRLQGHARLRLRLRPHDRQRRAARAQRRRSRWTASQPAA